MTNRWTTCGLWMLVGLLVLPALNTFTAEQPVKKKKRDLNGPLPVMLPLTEPGFYEKDGKKYERGLYPGGTNLIPEVHLQAGLRQAAAIVPMLKGQPEASGKIIVSTIGHSNPRAYFQHFEVMRAAKEKAGELNPQVTFNYCCFGGHVCWNWVEKCKTGKMSIDPAAQVLFVLITYHRANGTAPENDQLPFEQKMLKMKDDLKFILQTAAKHCPNLKIAIIGSDTLRAQYEPKVYEEGFAVKWLIEDQINGDPELKFEGPERKAPWLAWGGYIWEPDAPAERFKSDNVHPTEAGQAFVAGRWFDALLSNPAVAGWFKKK